MFRTICTITLTVLLMFLIVIANVRWRQQTQFQAGERGALAGDFMLALTGYESAIRMYLPFSETVETASARIWVMGETAEKRGDIERALIAYRSLRSALYGVGWLQQPGKEWIARCDLKIAALKPLRKGMVP